MVKKEAGRNCRRVFKAVSEPCQNPEEESQGNRGHEMSKV
jgi:hypothetical protein